MRPKIQSILRGKETEATDTGASGGSFTESRPTTGSTAAYFRQAR